MSATLDNFDRQSLMAKEIYRLEYRISELEDELATAEVERDNAKLDNEKYRKLREWAEAGKRQVKIVFGGPVGQGYENITVSDFALDVEQIVKDVSEINLVGRLKDKADWYEKRAAQLRQEIEMTEYRQQIEGGEQVEQVGNDNKISVSVGEV